MGGMKRFERVTETLRVRLLSATLWRTAHRRSALERLKARTVASRRLSSLTRNLAQAWFAPAFHSLRAHTSQARLTEKLDSMRGRMQSAGCRQLVRVLRGAPAASLHQWRAHAEKSTRAEKKMYALLNLARARKLHVGLQHFSTQARTRTEQEAKRTEKLSNLCKQKRACTLRIGLRHLAAQSKQIHIAQLRKLFEQKEFSVHAEYRVMNTFLAPFGTVIPEGDLRAKQRQATKSFPYVDL